MKNIKIKNILNSKLDYLIKEHYFKINFADINHEKNVRAGANFLVPIVLELYTALNEVTPKREITGHSFPDQIQAIKALNNFDEFLK